MNGGAPKRVHSRATIPRAAAMLLLGRHPPVRGSVPLPGRGASQRPEERESRFTPFVAGAAVYGLLVLL